MKILVPDSIRPFLRGRHVASSSDEPLPCHPYIRGGRTDEYLLLYPTLKNFLEQAAESRFGAAIDLGAGDGMLTRLLTDHFNRVVAVDTDIKSVRRLEKIVGRANAINCDAAQFLKNVKQKFRMIVLSHLLYYFRETDWPDFLELVASRLAPNGTIVICLWSSSCGAANLFRSVSLRRHEQPYAERAKEILTGIGFGIVVERILRAHHRFPLEKSNEILNFFSLNDIDVKENAISNLRLFECRQSYLIDQRDVFIAFRRH